MGPDGGPGPETEVAPVSAREDQEQEAVAKEEGKEDPKDPKVIRVPREPTQKEREAHEVLHTPHAEWCEFCVRGRARNRPHPHSKRGVRARPLPREGEGVVRARTPRLE